MQPSKKVSHSSGHTLPDKCILVDPAGHLLLHRGFKARQISMIRLGASLGTGFMTGSGTVLIRGGPLGLWFGYFFASFIFYLVMIALGGMAYLLHKKGFAGYATHYVDPALVSH